MELNQFYVLISIFTCSLSLYMICTGISYIIDAMGRYNYNTYWDDKEAEDSGNIK